MKRTNSVIVFCLVFLFSLRCVQSQETRRLPLDIKWVSSSVEYAANCVQTYRSAWSAVKEAAAKADKNWAVVLDVDETVLDNAQYAIERTSVDSGYTHPSWIAWVKREEAPLIPGAKAFIDSVRSLGPKAHIVYITNRDYEPEEIPTISNLRKHGVFRDGDLILTQRNREDTKVKRRECVETGTDRCESLGPLVIIALLGDNIRDFMPMNSREQADNYRANILADDNWGRKYFVLPNPTYGSFVNDYR